MADYEQVSRTSQAFRVNTPTAPQMTGDETGDEGGEPTSSVYSLVPRARAQTLSLTQPPTQIHGRCLWRPLAGKLDSTNYEKSYSASRSLRRVVLLKLLAHVDRLAVDDAQHSALSPFYSAWNDLESTTNLVFTLHNRRVIGYGSSLSTGAAASPVPSHSRSSHRGL